MKKYYFREKYEKLVWAMLKKKMKILFNFVIGIGLLNSSLKKKKMVSESWMSVMIFDWSLEIKSKSPCLKRLDGMDEWNLMFLDKIRISKKNASFFF